jgi:hypothetical protein
MTSLHREERKAATSRASASEIPVAGIADRGENACGETIHRTKLSGELVRTPPT